MPIMVVGATNLKETQKELDDVVIREQSPRTILPETYTGNRSVDAGTVDD